MANRLEVLMKQSESDNSAMEKKQYLGTYECKLCHKFFRRKDKLDRHFFLHTGIKAFKCKYDGCGKSYTNSSHLRRHEKDFHELKPEIYDYVCDHPGCLQGFTNVSNMNRHYKTAHERSSPYTCLECKISYRQRHQLKKHQKLVHNIGEFTYNCGQCGAGFFCIKDFNKHETTHKKTKERECSDCEQKFPNWTQLVRHKRVSHNVVRSFICDLCGKSFCRKPNIKQHMQLHLQTYIVYECDYENCSKFYNAKRNLNAHIRSKHQGRHFMCTICKCKLSTKSKLEQHMEGHKDPVREPLLKKSNISLLLGIHAFEKTEDELLKCFPKALRDPTTESELSDY